MYLCLNTDKIERGPLFFGHTAWHVCACMLSRFSHVWLCDPMDCSLPGSSVHGILQARILEWVATPSSRGSSRPRDQTCIGRPFTTRASLEAHSFNTLQIFLEHLLCARCCTGHYRTQQGTKSLSPWNAFSSGSTYVVLLKLWCPHKSPGDLVRTQILIQ